MKKLKRGMLLLAELLKYETAWICGMVWKCFCRSYRNVWLISERGREARDNGFHFFAYVTSEHPEINAWYVADKELPDYERVQKMGNTVPYRSWKHYMMCAVSKIKISTHILGYTPDIEQYYMLDKLHVVHGKRAFLQHGIIQNDMAWYHYPNVRTDLFVCSVPAEATFVQEKFQYPKGVVKCTGLCRFDALIKQKAKKRQLLIMPTWRSYAVEGKTKETFIETKYYQKYQQLIQAPWLKDLLERYDYTAVFYPHYEVQRFISAFHTENPRIQIGKLGEKDVQKLLVESEILITDFSSVHFDFAYMEKPVVYYQFDKEQFYGEHYAKGYFTYEKDGFGPVVQEAEELCRALTSILKYGRLEERYEQRIQQFFPLIDNRNCERNYDAVNELLRS